MKSSIWAIFSGLAVLTAIPASASNGTFNFTSGYSNSDLSSYSVTVGGVTATATALYATGTGSGPGTGAANKFQAGKVGEYTGAGMGICENQYSTNCSSPNHQIDNGTNASRWAYNPPNDFEFMLIQFSTAVNLSQIQLGNYGTNGSYSADPFLSTYFTSISSAGLSSITSALEATTVGGVAGTDGFSAAQSGTCVTGQPKLGVGGNGNGSYNDNCKVNGNGIVNLNGTDVTYLLFGASTASANVNNGYFKIQDLTASQYTGGSYTGGTQSATPEPATFGLIGSALAALGLIARKRKLS